jgi:ectoine hydroxylase-related dioxygenase (phytanoyl-CoA dioxygenase family)
MKAGDVIFWRQELPHFSTANKTDTPRVCCYYSLFPVDEDWYGSTEQKWLKKQVKELQAKLSIQAVESTDEQTAVKNRKK